MGTANWRRKHRSEVAVEFLRCETERRAALACWVYQPLSSVTNFSTDRRVCLTAPTHPGNRVRIYLSYGRTILRVYKKADEYTPNQLVYCDEVRMRMPGPRNTSIGSYAITRQKNEDRAMKRL